jgi:hypothetical protein
MTNDELIEELLWEAHGKGLGIEMLNLAGKYIKEQNMRKSFAYQKAYDELQIKYY